MQRDRLAYLLIPLAALLAILPLVVNGCSCGHDFDFHLLNWMEAARQFTHGNLHPHWAYTAAFNAGEPRFVFYPPASWTLGAILGLTLRWTWTPIVYTWLALTLSGLAMHRLTREFSTPAPALLASVLYAVNPYMLFTAYERTAYAELLAAAWIPLLLHAILRTQITIPRIATPVALLWITNAPAAVMSCYALALLATIRLIASHTSPAKEPVISSEEPGAPYLDSEMWASRASATAPAHSSPPQQSRLEQARNTIAGTALGLGLAAFYIVPAAYERRFVQIAMALVPGMRIRDNFLFHHTGDIPHDEVLHTASLLAISLLSATVLSLAALRLRRSPAQSAAPQHSRRQSSFRLEPRSLTARWSGEIPALRSSGRLPSTCVQPDQRNFATELRVPHTSQSHRDVSDPRLLTRRPLLLPLAALTVAITLLLTPIAAPLWNHLPELAFLQFPWRLIAILAAVLGLAIAAALPSFSPSPAVSSALAISLAASFTLPAQYAFHQSCDLEDTVSSRLALFHSNRGSDPTDEYTPTTADNDSLAQSNPGYWLALNPDAKAPANSSPGPAPTHLTLNSPFSQTLILNLRAYPSWRVTRNGDPIAPNEQTQRDDGLITVPLSAGPSDIDITYAQTRDQTLGDLISLASLLLLFLISRSKPKAAS